MRFVVFVCGLLLLCLPSSGNEWYVRTFVSPAGKTFEEVRDIKKTGDDALWFASWGNGIARLKGSEWRVFTLAEGLSSNFIPAIETDGNNGVWAATDNGISHVSAEGEIVVLSQEELPFMDEPSLNEVKRLESGEVWFGSDSGSIIGTLAKSEPRSVANPRRTRILGDRQWFTVREPSAPDGHGIYEILETEDEGIWVAADRGGFFHFHDSRWERIPAETYQADRSRSLAQDANGDLWSVGGALITRGETGWHRVDDLDAIVLTASPSGKIFLVGMSEIHYRVDETWESEPFPEEVGSPKARTVFFADDSHAWIGTKEGILEVIRPRFQEIHRSTDAFDNQIYGFVAVPETRPLAMINRYDLAQSNGKTWEVIVRLPSDAPDCRWLTHPVNEKVWAYAGERLYLISLTEKSIVRAVPQPEGMTPNGILCSADGKLLVYGDSGLSLLQDGKWISLAASPQDPPEPILSVSETRDGSLLLCKPTSVERWTWSELERISFQTVATNVHPLTAALETRDGKIWTGSRGHGVLVQEGDEREHISVENGLLSNRITAIHESPDETLWLGSEHLGLSSYKDGRWIRYSHTQGIGSEQLASIGEYPAGIIWMNSYTNRIYRYAPDRHSPDTHIEKFPATIPHNGFGIFTFSGYDHWNHTPTQDLAYSWRIVSPKTNGHSTEWSAFATDSSVQTPTLPPGLYRFEVRAADLDRNIDASPAFAAYKILPPPIVSRPWFIPLISFFILLTLTLALVAGMSRKKLAVYTGNLEVEVQRRTVELTNANELLKAEINDRAKLQETLAENERMYRKAIEIADAVPYSRGRTATCYEYIGEGIVRLTGYTPEEFTPALWKTMALESRFYDETTHTADLSSAERRARGEDMEWRADYKIRTKSGDIKWIANAEIRIRDIQEGVNIGSLGILQDITERKRIEEEELKSSKLESVGLLAGGIAHDFNNLLTAILGNVSLAKRLCDPSGKICKRLTEAEKASIRAQTLTQQLLTFSKGGMPVKETADIAQIVRETTLFTLTGSNVRCEQRFEAELWKVEVDKGQFSQVIQNLVLNAKQAMPEGGVVEVSAENAVGHVSDDEPLADPQDKEYVKLTIRDHGVGIPEESLGRVFDPYFTTKEEGSGLGLATSYSIVKKHGGTLRVESELGKGTTFTICLPSVPGPIQPAAPTQERNDHPIDERGRILVMDDEGMVRDVACAMLRQMGYAVVDAADGDETLRLYREGRETGKPFDAVIMDLTIPGGMGGKETIRKLREIDPHVVAIVSSGYSGDPIMAEYRQHGFNAVIGKPYSVEELGAVLTRTRSDV